MKVLNPNNLPTIPIADLLPTQGNLKDLSKENYKKLKNNIKNRGFLIPVYTWVNKETGLRYLLDGHQRQRVLTAEGWDEPIPYLTIDSDTQQEAMAILLEVTSQYGTITQEGLDEFIANYKLDEDEIYSATNYDALVNYQDDENEEVVDDNPYTGKIEVPIYEIKDEKPYLAELFDKTKTDNLIKQIEQSKLPIEIKEFLKIASYRHTVFNYAKIAEYYADSSKEVQELFEMSALVIIDYEKAIENGFIKLSEKIARQFVDDQN